MTVRQIRRRSVYRVVPARFGGPSGVSEPTVARLEVARGSWVDVKALATKSEVLIEKAGVGSLMKWGRARASGYASVRNENTASDKGPPGRACPVASPSREDHFSACRPGSTASPAPWSTLPRRRLADEPLPARASNRLTCRVRLAGEQGGGASCSGKGARAQAGPASLAVEEGRVVAVERGEL